jgi:hypothetical protein
MPEIFAAQKNNNNFAKNLNINETSHNADFSLFKNFT